MRLSKSNQVQLFLYFLLQWSLDSVNAETSLQIPLPCSFTTETQKGAAITSKQVLVDFLIREHLQQKVIFSGVEKLKRKITVNCFCTVIMKSFFFFFFFFANHCQCQSITVLASVNLFTVASTYTLQCICCSKVASCPGFCES